MKRVFATLLAVGAATVWLGCSQTAPPETAVEQVVEETTADGASTDTELVTVTLNVPHMV